MGMTDWADASQFLAYVVLFLGLFGLGYWLYEKRGGELSRGSIYSYGARYYVRRWRAFLGLGVAFLAAAVVLRVAA